MGQGRAVQGHIYPDDELGKLAGVALSCFHVNRSSRETFEDCFQAAYMAGLVARAAARRADHHTSSRLLVKKMRQAVYRLLTRRRELREADLVVCA